MSHGIVTKDIKQVLSFSELTYSHLNRITKGNFPKKIIQENNLAFLDNESGTLV